MQTEYFSWPRAEYFACYFDMVKLYFTNSFNDFICIGLKSTFITSVIVICFAFDTNNMIIIWRMVFVWKKLQGENRDWLEKNKLTKLRLRPNKTSNKMWQMKKKKKQKCIPRIIEWKIQNKILFYSKIDYGFDDRSGNCNEIILVVMSNVRISIETAHHNRS